MGNSCTKADDAADAEGRVTQPSSHTQSSPHRRSHVQPAQRMSRSGSVDVVGDEGGSRGQPQPSELTRVPVLPASSAGMKGTSRTGGVQSPPRVASVHSIASATGPAMEQSNHLSHSKRSTIQTVDDGQVSLGSDTVEGARDRFSVSTATVGSLTGPTTGTSAQGASPTRSAAQPQAARRENQMTLSPSSPKLASPATAEGAMRYQSGSGTTAEEGGGGGGAQHQSLLQRQDTTFTSNNDTAQPVAASSQLSFGGATLGDVPLITLADCDPGEESNRAATPRPALATEAVEAMDKGMPEEIGAEQLLQSWLDEQLAVRVRRTPFPKGKNQSLSVSTSQRAGNHVGTLSVSSLYGLSGGEASGSTSHQAATAGAGAVMTQPSGMASRLASLADELVAEMSSDKRRAAAAAPAPSLQHSPKQSTDPPPSQQLNQLPAEAFGDQSFAESFSVSPNTSHLQPKRRDVTEVILRNVNRRRSSGAPAVSSSGSGLAGHTQGQGDIRAIIPRSDHNFLDPSADGLGLVPTTTNSSD
jgi:hypothetical protein